MAAVPDVILADPATGQLYLEAIPNLGPTIQGVLASTPTVVGAAADAVADALLDAHAAPSEATTTDAFTVRFDDGVPFLTATEAGGVVSKITHIAGSVPTSALSADARSRMTPPAAVVALDDSQGWAFAIYYENGEVALGQRLDGTVYPPAAPLVTPPAGLTLHGDSLAAGWASFSATGELATLTGRPVAVDAIGGQRVAQVAARQGGAPALLTVSGGVIPASGAVAITDWSVDLLNPPTAGYSTIVGSLGGVKGTLRGGKDTGAATNTYTFTRTTPGAAMSVPPATPFVPGAAALKTIPVFIHGRNDVGSGGIGGGYGFRTPLVNILDTIERELEHTPNRSRAIVLSPLPTTDERNRPTDGSHPYDQLVAGMKQRFPAEFADWAAFLRSDSAFAAAGISKTTQDIQDIADGVTPASFRGDVVHPQAVGYKASNAFLAGVITSRD